MEQGLLHLYWGDGKGKTTASVGLCVRALGAGERVYFTQFLKGGDSAELESLRKTAAKAKKRYQSKYSGTKLRNYVFRYCSAQGFDVEDIYLILSEMEWDDE